MPKSALRLVDDDEEIIDAPITDFKSPHKDGRDHEQGGAPAMCPECGKGFAKIEDLGPHLVRHEPVGDGPKYSEPTKRGKVKLLSIQCPKGCKRWFTTKPMGSYRAHVAMCNGELPIESNGLKEDSAMPKFNCAKHEFSTTNPRSWGQHQRNHHKNDRATAAPSRSTPPPGRIAIPRGAAIFLEPDMTPASKPIGPAVIPGSPAIEAPKPDSWYKMVITNLEARKADMKVKYDLNIASIDKAIEALKSVSPL